MKLLFIIFFISVSCGKSTLMPPATKNTFNNQPQLNRLGDSIIGDKTCIDDKLINELEEDELTKKTIDDADINFCNGLRIRIKIIKTTKNKTLVYGFAESSSGRRTCLREDKDFKRILFLGSRGSLVGEEIKISLGGHSYDSKGKLIKSAHLSGRNVDFKIASFSGEIGFFEKGKLKCWSMN